jgi:vacuolar protein sorting-associated protein 35
MISKNNPEKGVKLYLMAASTADGFASQSSSKGEESDFGPISYELLRQAVTLYEDRITEPNAQCRCITSFAGTLLALQCVDRGNYETLVTKTAQFSAKVVLKPEQCQLVALCAYLFFPAENARLSPYQNPQRALECLQRSLKLADACTTANSMYISLFVDLLEHYLYFFEKKNALITPAYISGLVALIQEHLSHRNAVVPNEKDIQAHFTEVVRYIKQRKADSEVADLFSMVQIDT